MKHLCPRSQQFGIGVTFDLDLWPTDLKINRYHLLIKDNLPTKFEVCEVKCTRVTDCTRWGRPTDLPTFVIYSHMYCTTYHVFTYVLDSSSYIHLHIGRFIIYLYPRKQYLWTYRNKPVCLSVCPSVHLLIFGFHTITLFIIWPTMMILHSFAHDLRRTPIDFGVKKSRSQDLDNWKWVRNQKCFPVSPISTKLNAQTPNETRMPLLILLSKGQGHRTWIA